MPKPIEIGFFSFFPYDFSISWMDGGDFSSPRYHNRESIPKKLLVGLIQFFFLQVAGLLRLKAYYH